MSADNQKNQHNILIVDDDQGLRSQLKWAFKKQYQIFEAANVEEALSIAKQETINLVSLDITLNEYGGNGTEGLEVLKQLNQLDPDMKVIMVTGQEDRKLAIESLRYGAYDYYQKPIDMNELKIIFQRALHIQNLERENQLLIEKLQDKKQFQHIIGNCPEIRKIFDTIEKVATTDATILVTGESGTGKELVARAVHNMSQRAEKPFIPINCGAIPENLLESELFGHEKGAFTGAYYRKIGKFEDANQGTIFLDEIGELSPNLQVKLLRFIQERVIERVGGRNQIPIDTRIIAATNKDLEKLSGSDFREDLFYRISVITISLPPLKERGDDILLLAYHYLNRYKDQYKKNIIGFSAKAESDLKRYPWPGNVRELENKIKRAVIMSGDRYISPDDLQLKEYADLSDMTRGLKGILEDVEKRAVKDALIDFSGNISKAAEHLSVSRASLYDLMRKHHIDRNQYKK